jgi:hypothetical protein
MLHRLVPAALLVLAVSACYDGSELMTAGTLAVSTGGLEDPTTGTTTTDATTDTPVTTTNDATTGDLPGTLSDADPTTTADPFTTTGDDSSSGDGTTGDLLETCPRLRVQVAPDPTLNVRPTPSTEQEPVGSLVHGQIVDTVAAVQGEAIEGNTLWYQIAAPAGYVSGVFVECTMDLPPEPPAGFFLPFECNKSVLCTQGNSGDLSHNGITEYAFDFGLGLNTPVHASADGIVTNIYDLTGPGDPCYGGGGPDCGYAGNLVILLHGDGTTTLYKHLNEIHVTIGQEVPRGGVVGLSGSTGYSTGPHLHTMRMMNCGANNCQSIPMEYVEAGVPVEGQTVQSQNCP